MEKVLEINGLYKDFKKHKILKDISFNVYENEIVGFIGPNGAGKSTLMKCVSGLIFPTSGSIRVCGFDVVKERNKALSLLASLIEMPGLYTTMSGRENLDLIAKLRGVGKERLKEVYEFTHLKEHLDKSVARYSLGMKQRLALGIVILGKPKFIILDEPTNGLDPRGIMELRNTLRQLVEKEGVSILLSSHSLSEIDKIADRIVCINHGQLIDTPDALFKQSNYIIATDQNGNLYNYLKDFQYFKSIEIHEKGVTFELLDPKMLQDVLSKLIESNITYTDFYKDEMDMESIYVSLYGTVG